MVVWWSQRIRSFIRSGKHNNKRETRKFVFSLFCTTLKTSNFCFSLQGKQYSRCIIDTRQDWVMGVSWQGGKSCGKESFSVVSEKTQRATDTGTPLEPLEDAGVHFQILYDPCVCPSTLLSRFIWWEMSHNGYQMGLLGAKLTSSWLKTTLESLALVFASQTSFKYRPILYRFANRLHEHVDCQ